MSPINVTASQLYNYVICPHRVYMDAFEDASRRDEPNAFVELLWERGSIVERDTIASLKVPFTDLSALSGNAKRDATVEAIRRGDDLIYSGRLAHDDLLGEPDLLRREREREQGHPLYVPIDIKSGAGREGGDDDSEAGKLKRTYAVQLALYTELLSKLGVSAGRYAFVWDISGRQVRYEFDEPQGPRTPETLWTFYTRARDAVRSSLARESATSPALGAPCNLCVWRTACLHDLKSRQDLTLLPELGRARRDSLQSSFPTIAALATSKLEPFVNGKKTVFSGIGPDMLRRFQVRAQLAVSADQRAFLKAVRRLPEAQTELFFDIETNPLRDFCYLHGIVARQRGENQSEKYYGFFADELSRGGERDAFANAWEFLTSQKDAAVYIFSKYERTIYRKLAGKFPEVCTEEEVEAFFAPPLVTDLYFDVVRPDSEWPTQNFSLKSIAKYLGFQWRDTHPSGAASIEWYERFLRTRDEDDRQRILDYNEDDCRAMRILKDALLQLEVRPIAG